MTSILLLAVGVLLSGALFAGCGDDNSGCGATTDAKENVYCCALKLLATNCTPQSPAKFQSTIDDWMRVGDNGDPQACQALIDNGMLYCTAPSDKRVYDETDAVAECSGN